MTKMLAIFTIILTLGQTVIAIENANPDEKKVENFSLRDYRGKNHSLDDFKDRDVIVLVILGTECPLAKLYAPRLAKLSKELESKNVQFLGINSNSQDSITEIAAHARIHNIEFPVLKDVGNRVADQIGAKRTPEVFVLNKDRIVVYHGRVDDQFGVGYTRDEPRRHDLKIALDELVAGKKISVPKTDLAGCFIGRVKKAKSSGSVTFSNQISRLLQKHCVECHRQGEIAPFALSDYDEVVGWADMIEEVLTENRMPPWHADKEHGEFANDRRMSDEDKKLIYQWVADGAPQGDPKNLPEPRKFTSGWQLPKDPHVLKINTTPFRVRPEGQLKYEYFRIKSKFKEDKWISAAQILPGNRAVVHHILAFTLPPGQEDVGAMGGAGGYLVAYVPGLIAEPFPKGMAKHVPAGSDLVFQVHYTPIGTERYVTSRIGFVFADPEEITHQVRSFSAVQTKLEIPAKENNYPASATTKHKLDDAILLSMMPHMHLRGKDFRYELLDSKNRPVKTLLNVPAFDFNWQTSYRLKKPFAFPAGSKIKASAHFDNSDDNLSNPNSSVLVEWGDQTDDEMMIGYFDIAQKVDPAKPFPPVSSLDIPDRAKLMFRRFDKDRDGFVTKSEFPERSRRLFAQMDGNGDEKLTLDELRKALKRRRR